MRHKHFTCSQCGLTKPLCRTFEFTTGYGINKQGKKVCFECCGIQDKADMLARGRATLYLKPPANGEAGAVTNWPGTLRFPVLPGGIRKGRHNIAGTRYDVWFTGPDAKQWHGVQYGENTQLCHCRRTKDG